MNLSYLTITEALRLLSKGDVSSSELTEYYLKRSKQLEPSLHSYITLNDDAVEQARASDQRRHKGELKGAIDGIPGALKDVIVTRSFRTTAASKMLDNFVPPYEAWVSALLDKAGMILLGKTNLDEFAMGTTTVNSAYGVTKNPWDTTRVVGGSSGGSAAAVAADQCLFSLGTDTGGSIRLPASWSNTVGLRPTYGRVSRNGVIAMASSLDQVGTFTRSVEDAALILGLISQHDPGDSTAVTKPMPDYHQSLSKDLKGIRVGVVKEYFGDGVEPHIKETAFIAIKQLEKLGATVKEVSLPLAELSLAVYCILVPAEVSTNLERYDGIKYGYSTANQDANQSLKDVYVESRNHFGAEAKRRIMLGTYALSAGYYDAYYAKAQKVRTLIINEFNQVFKDHDVLVGPVAPTAPFKINDNLDDPLKLWMADVLAVPVNIAGLPGMSVPCGFDQNLPVGLQIIANKFDEEHIVAVASAYEASTEWHTKHPEMEVQNG